MERYRIRPRSGFGASSRLAATVLFISLSASRPTLAGEAENAAAAESLFLAGRELMDQGKPKEACSKFEESNRLQPSAGTLLNFGRCLEEQGKVASAWAMYKRAIVLGKSTNQLRQVTAAEGFVEAVKPRLPMISVTTAEPIPGARIHAGELAIAEASLGTPIAVDPGAIEIHVEAPGFEPWSGTLTATEGQTTSFTVPKLQPIPAAPRVPPPPPPPPPPPEGVDPLLVAGLAVGGAGVVALGVGGVFGGMTLSDASRAEADPALCPNRRCSDAGRELIENAEDKALLSTVLFAAGGAALAGGTALAIVSFVTPAEPKRLSLAPWVGPTGLGLSMGGAW